MITELAAKNIAKPPKWLPSCVHYETIMGSQAYGVASDNSDIDIYGFCIPPKEDIFPHLRGDIIGFGKQKNRFEQYQEHHLFDKDALGGKGRTYDITIYSIIRFFQLAMENNPNMVDALFTDVTCMLTCSTIGNMVREKRHIFLHKGCWPKFKGYSFAQLAKIDSNNKPTGKRKELVEKFGWDTKYGSHVVRLLSEVEQILTLGDVNLQRDNEVVKAVKRGEWSLEQLKQWFSEKEKFLEKAYEESTLPWGPREDEIKTLLLNCLEHQYGNLSACITLPEKAVELIREISEKILLLNSLT